MTPPITAPSSKKPLPTVVEQELAKYQSTLDALHAGAIDPDKEFKPFRLVQGVYGQRQGGENQMVRIKLKYGVVTPEQMRRLADTSEKYTNGISHITTRQAIQFHYIPLDSTPALLRDLEEVGMTTREACGNAVRAVCGSPNAGTLIDEPFDIDPYSEAVFQHFLRGPRSASLPRKFKISLGSSDRDPLQQINIQDVGIMAVTVDGVQGFRVVAAGGLGSMPVPPVKLYDCLPKDQLIPVCDALVRVHHKYGDRTNRAKARLKFVLKAKGEEGFKALFQEQLAEAIKDGIRGQALPDTLKPANPTPIPAAASSEEGAWRKANVRPHREAGLAVVSLRIPRGDVPAREMRVLADLAEWFSDGDARTTNDQNIIFRRVQHQHLSKLFVELKKLGYHDAAHGFLDVVSCPGASTCMLGICLSKNMATELEKALAPLGAKASLTGSRINISGCPNSCGQHHIGTIGLHGAASKIGDKLIPHYVLFVGGGDEGEQVHHGTMVARIPARKAAATISALVGWFEQERKGQETFAQYLRRLVGVGLDKDATKAAKAALKERLTPIFALTEGQISEQDLHDYGSDKLFSLDELGAGECMS
jgi:sulfite reductase beta subunit-like hemoprotein